MTSVKSVLAYSILLVLDCYIDILSIFVHFLNFMLNYSADSDNPPVNGAAPLSTVGEIGVCDDGMMHKSEPNDLGITSIGAKDDPSSKPLLPTEGRPRSSSAPCLPSIPIYQDKMVAVLSTSSSPMPDLPDLPSVAVAPVSWTPPEGLQPQRMNSDKLDTLPRAASERDTYFRRQTCISGDGPDSGSGGDDDRLRLIVPCWDCKDVIEEGSTCPVVINPGLNASLDVLLRIELRTKELWDNFAFDRNTSWLKHSSHIFDHVLAVPHPGDEFLSCSLLKQADIRAELFRTTDEDSCLDQSIDGYQTALTILPDDVPLRHKVLSRMGDLLKKRHDKKKRGEDLHQMINAYTEALTLWPRDEDPPLEVIYDLGTALLERCETGVDVSDVESAIHHLDRLLSVVDGDHPLRPIVLSNLGIAFRTRSEMTGSVADVERAICHLKDALSSQTDDDPNRLITLNCLADAFSTRCNLSGRFSDLDDAIRLCQRALLLRSDDPGTLSSLANALSQRYDRTGNATDQEEAILHLEKAISLVGNDDPGRAVHLANLASMLRNRYEISWDVTDLNKAINLHKEALSVRPPGHPIRLIILNNLCHSLLTRFQISGNASDKRSMLDCFAEALSLSPPAHPIRRETLFHLLLTRSTLAPWDSLPTDNLTLVLDQCTELAKLTLQQQPEYSKTMTLVVPILLACHKRQLDIGQLLLATGLNSQYTAEDAALTLLGLGSMASASPSLQRLKVTCQWIELCQELNHPCTPEMFTAMFDLLDLSIARTCSLESRHKHLSRGSWIASAKHLVPEAVAFAIEHGMIEEAVEFLERGQSILLSQLSRYRSSSMLDAVRSVRPDLVTRFQNLSWQVEHATFTERQPLSSSDHNRPLEDPISRSNRLKTEWEDVVQQIRALDGFHNFLRPSPFLVLQQAAAEGPVILVNISKSRSDAIIITSEHPTIVVPLPFATPDQVSRLVSMFKASPQSISDRIAMNGLKTVWDIIAEPVITELQNTLKLPRNSRIWWCPTNSAISLPLHAAGVYRLKDDHHLVTRNCVPSLYISSYTPSLGALLRARQDRPHHSGLPTVLLVGQPNTPHQPEIPLVREEISLIKKRIPHCLVLMDERGTHDAVLSAIVQHPWVHLACHGHLKSDDPLHSHFALHDGPLPLLEIMRQRLPMAELAFLSACHSASSDSDAPDEFLHLAAGMQFAGFRSVVGTMWAMADYAGPPLADEFYRRMFPKAGGVAHTMTAWALHEATRKLQRNGLPLAVWINFVHWGA